MKQQIYLDNGATTPVHPRVLEKMAPFFTERFGNPSSIHSIGRAVKLPLEDARKAIAEALNTIPPRINFTSGGTESDFTAIVGTALGNMEKGKHIIVSEIEHSAIIEATKFLMQFGFETTYLPVNQYGMVEIEALQREIREDTILISIMHVNNELGTIQPIEEIGIIARAKGILFHTDAVQSFPILDLDVKKLPVDILTISSHKINGPKGVGAIYLREGVKFKPIFSGSQEKSRRGGTENVPGIIGFGEATNLLVQSRQEKYQKFTMYKNKMLEIWKEAIGEENFVVNGHPTNVVPSILNVSFPSVTSHTMIMALDMKGIAISGGSACASGAIEISRVIKSLKLEEEIAKSAVRISFGSFNTLEEIEKAAKEIANVLKERNIKRK